MTLNPICSSRSKGLLYLYSAKHLLLVLALFCFLIPNSWAQRRQLGVRNAHVMVFDQKHQQVLLFGGADEKQVLGDLWRFSGKKWKMLKAKGPAPRTFPAIVYDEKNERTVLFGGSKVLFGQETSADNLLNDTWEYKNKRWKRLITDQAPIPRAEAEMAYDPIRQKIYLFGGYTIEGDDYIKLGDTWELDGNQWEKMTETGPSVRHGVVLVYHNDMQKLFLFGGSTADRAYGDQTGESWIFDGQSWTKLDIAQPPNIFNAATAMTNDRLIRFGGWNGKERINETWQFVNGEWNKLSVSPSPSPRNHSALVWDEKNKRLLLFGGHDGENVFGDTWSFERGTWKLLLDQPAQARVSNGH